MDSWKGWKHKRNVVQHNFLLSCGLNSQLLITWSIWWVSTLWKWTLKHSHIFSGLPGVCHPQTNLNFHSYTDDTQLYFSFNPPNLCCPCFPRLLPPSHSPPHIRTHSRAIDKWAALADVFVTPAAHSVSFTVLFMGHIWHLFLLLAPSGAAGARAMEEAGSLGRAPPGSRALCAAAVVALTALTTAEDAFVQGVRSLCVMNGVTRALPSSCRNTLRLFHLPGIQSGRISLHITKAL